MVRIALIGDIEKAFLMVGIAEEDRASLRYLWVKDPNTEPVELVKLCFTRVVFGVTSSPFPLNATINTHIKKCKTLSLYLLISSLELCMLMNYHKPDCY